MVEHVDEHNAERPDVGCAGPVRGCDIIPALYRDRVRSRLSEVIRLLAIAHVRRTTAVHITALDVGGGQTKVGKLDEHLALAAAVDLYENVGDDEVLRLDIAVEYTVVVEELKRVAHMCEDDGD